jgi:hypothetical protein
MMQAAYQNIAQNPVYYVNQPGYPQQQSQNPIYPGNQQNYNAAYGQPANQN